MPAVDRPRAPRPLHTREEPTSLVIGSQGGGQAPLDSVPFCEQINMFSDLRGTSALVSLFPLC